MKRTPLKRKTPLKRGPWRREPPTARALGAAIALLDSKPEFRDAMIAPGDMARARRKLAARQHKRHQHIRKKTTPRGAETQGGAKLRRIQRTRMLTDAEARENERVIAAVMKEFPPARKRLKPQSERMREKQKEYRKAKRAWWKARIDADGGRCEAVWEYGRCTSKASDKPHHKAGRLGANLADAAKFMAVCMPCHRRIHDSPADATERGYIIREYSKT